MWELELGYYKCVRCGGDMVALLDIDDLEPRLVYKTDPVACPRCDDIAEAIVSMAEAILPELVDRLKRFFF
jgi:DNA-directed RNA polymerase subunit RPC12/RpoP